MPCKNYIVNCFQNDEPFPEYLEPPVAQKPFVDLDKVVFFSPFKFKSKKKLNRESKKENILYFSRILIIKNKR